mmetsp:Transcript_26881/g.69114  ORF Transcript_26881/g.69114 Transcript_26881/m.69114 type:complete len:273 (-) Transcript_26881:430-1248(-)
MSNIHFKNQTSIRQELAATVHLQDRSKVELVTLNLKEIVGGTSYCCSFIPLGSGIVLKESVFQHFIKLKDSSLITASVAVIRSRKYGHNIMIVGPFKTFHDQLVSSYNQTKAIHVVELLRDILTKSVACATRRDTPPGSFVRIGPKEVAHRPFMRGFLYSIKCTHMVKSVQRRRKATMGAKYLGLDKAGKREVIKKIGKPLPNVRVTILPQTFIIKSINLSNLPALVISANDCYSVWVPDTRKTLKGRPHQSVLLNSQYHWLHINSTSSQTP